MKKVIYVVALLIGLQGCAPKYRLLTNYKISGTKDCLSDQLEVTFSPSGARVADGVTGLIAPAASLAFDLINNQIQKRQAEYTATYNNATTFFRKDTFSLRGGSILLQRNMIQKEEANVTAMEASLKFDDEATSGKIMLRLSSVKLPYSKARYNKADENISVSIDLTLSGYIKGKDGLKKMDIGQSTIIVPIITPEAELIAKDFVKFKNGTFACFDDPGGKLASLTVTAKITEVNTTRLTPSTIQTLLKSNSGDVVSLIKALIPSSSGSSGKGGN